MNNSTLYSPKAIRGQSIRGYTKVSRKQVEKLFKTDRNFDGFIVGNKVSSFYFFGGWHLACEFIADSQKDFNNKVNSFLFYLDKELGNNIAIYIVS